MSVHRNSTWVVLGFAEQGQGVNSGTGNGDDIGSRDSAAIWNFTEFPITAEAWECQTENIFFLIISALKQYW